MYNYTVHVYEQYSNKAIHLEDQIFWGISN